MQLNIGSSKIPLPKFSYSKNEMVLNETSLLRFKWRFYFNKIVEWFLLINQAIKE